MESEIIIFIRGRGNDVNISPIFNVVVLSIEACNLWGAVEVIITIAMGKKCWHFLSFYSELVYLFKSHYSALKVIALKVWSIPMWIFVPM